MAQSQSETCTKAETIWNDANSGNVKLLKQSIKGATTADLCFEKRGGPSNRFHFTALMQSAWKGRDDIVALLIAAGADVNYHDTQAGDTALMWATYMGHVAIMSALLQAGADTNAYNKNHYTPLMEAANEGHVDALTMLLESAADLTLFDTRGYTALHLSSSKGHSAAVQMLLDAAAPVNEEIKAGWTALHFACNRGHADIVQLLLDAKADVNVLDQYCRNAADVALTPEIKGLIAKYCARTSLGKRRAADI